MIKTEGIFNESLPAKRDPESIGSTFHVGFMYKTKVRLYSVGREFDPRPTDRRIN